MISSIFIYLITFGMSISAAYILSLFYKRNYLRPSSEGKRKNINFILYFFIIVPPCLLAAMRDYSVGIDMLNFSNRIYPIVLSSQSFNSFNNIINNELLYNLLVYYPVKFTGGVGFFLFMVQLIVIAPITVVGYKMRNEVPIWAIISVYLFVFFNNSLNLMQQSMAASIVLLSSIHWIEKRKLSSTILFIIASLIHQSALLFIPVFILSNFIIRDKKIKWRQSLVIIILVFMLLRVFDIAVTWLVFNTNLLPDSYLHYYNIFITKSVFMEYYIDPLSIYSLFDLIMRMIFVIIPITLLNKKMQNNKNIRTEKFITLISLILYSFILFQFNTMYGGRISLYGDFFIIVFLARITSFERYTLFYRLLFWSVILMYWFVFVIRLGWSGTSYYLFRL